MGQEFFIKDQKLEDKVRELLPSQGGLGAGFDLSASTQIIPIVDLTESAEGSNLRADLQTATSLSNITAFSVFNATDTLITNTGFYRVFGNFVAKSSSTLDVSGFFAFTDGVTTKRVTQFFVENSTAQNHVVVPFDFNVFLSAGDSFQGNTANGARLLGSTRQIATINGELVNPNE